MYSGSGATNLKLLVRSLLPSGTSLMLTLAISAIMIGGHILLVTLQGTVPAVLDEHAIQDYTETIVDPLMQVTNNVTVNNSLGVLLWALFGWILYAFVAFIANSISDLRSARQQVQYHNGQTFKTPMHRSLLLRLIWRLFVSILLVAFTVAMSRAMHYAFMQDYHILSSQHVPEILRLIAVNVVIWMGMTHGYVVLLRWYVLRTRVFGEIIY